MGTHTVTPYPDPPWGASLISQLPLRSNWLLKASLCLLLPIMSVLGT